MISETSLEGNIMTNERLRASIVGSGLTLQTLSEQIGVDRKTVERWITTGRTPHRRHRMAVAAALATDDAYLWPEAVSSTERQSASQAEFVAIYPSRGALTGDTWSTLIDGATESIDVLAFAGSFLPDTVPDYVDRLADRARDGVHIRILLGDPDSDAVRLRGDEEGIGDSLAARCKLSWKYVHGLDEIPGVHARMHAATLYQSIFRFDDDLFANTHVYGAAASHSPIIHVHRVPGGRLFANFLDGFERTWASARDVQLGRVA
jgi:lambda repressor-like predicted transcriptional regulator